AAGRHGAGRRGHQEGRRRALPHRGDHHRGVRRAGAPRPGGRRAEVRRGLAHRRGAGTVNYRAASSPRGARPWRPRSRTARCSSSEKEQPMRITEITPAQAVTIAGGPTLCTPGEAATAVADMLQDPTVAQGHRLADAVAHVQHAVREACPWWDTIQAPEGASAWSDQE